MEKINLFWFRRDLRLFDNHALYKALKEGNVLPIFIFDTDLLNTVEDRTDRRINFIYSELLSIKQKLESLGSTLHIFHDSSLNVFKDLFDRYHVSTLYFNHDYEPFATKRDNEIIYYATLKGIRVISEKDQVIFEKNEILKSNSEPYTIFTPYSNKWKDQINQIQISEYKSENLLNYFYKTNPIKLVSLNEMGFQEYQFDFPKRLFNEEIIKNYHNTRDYPSIVGTSKLSVHLRFGTISIRQLVKYASKLNTIYLNELIWREFYMMILWHFPQVVDHSFKRIFDRIEWRNNEKDFEAWRNGKTGYPIVDAGMRELNTTGFMHNRARMITASFLTKHLLIDWRWGEAYFAQKLLDYELASNNGGWQWAASTGCDAVPYFRIFNPLLQAKKFDPNREYIKKWVPEIDSKDYPKPIIDHQLARERALKTYKNIQK